MDRMYYINTTTPRTEVYLGNSEADLALMPTTTIVGQAPYKKALAPENSVARIITTSGLKTYILRSTGWVDVTSQMSGGGSGGSEGLPPGYEIADDDEDIGSLFNGSNPNNPGADSGNSNTASNSDIGNLFGG